MTMELQRNVYANDSQASLPVAFWNTILRFKGVRSLLFLLACISKDFAKY